MKRSDQEKISRLDRRYRTILETTLDYPQWLSIFFWDDESKEQIAGYLETFISKHGDIVSVRSLHPSSEERTPIHLSCIYRHEITLLDGTQDVLFQKFNFSAGFNSLFTSLTWSYLSNLSPSFRRNHRLYEKQIGRSFQLVHPHPRSLWENYKLFLSTVGTHWSTKGDTPIGPSWVVLTDVSAVTCAVTRTNRSVGDSVYTCLVTAIHKARLQKKQFEQLGIALAKTVQSCYSHRDAFVDVGLGNYIMDSKGNARFIDGELLQVFPGEVPSHYKALELVMFMETLYLETVRDYCKTINSRNHDEIRKYQHGLLLFFSAFLKELRLSKEEIDLAQTMYLDWSTKLGTFFFTFLLLLRCDPRVILQYRTLFLKDFVVTLDEQSKLQNF
jgi:hypothetical protein